MYAAELRPPGQAASNSPLVGAGRGALGTVCSGPATARATAGEVCRPGTSFASGSFSIELPGTSDRFTIGRKIGGAATRVWPQVSGLWSSKTAGQRSLNEETVLRPGKAPAGKLPS